MITKHGVWELVDRDHEMVQLKCDKCNFKKRIKILSWNRRNIKQQNGFTMLSEKCKCQMDRVIKEGTTIGLFKAREDTKHSDKKVKLECTKCGLKKEMLIGNFKHRPNIFCKCLGPRSAQYNYDRKKPRINAIKKRTFVSPNDAFLAKFDEEAIAERCSINSGCVSRSCEVRTGTGTVYASKSELVIFLLEK